MLLLWAKVGVSVRETGELDRSDGGDVFPVRGNPYAPAVVIPSIFEVGSPLESAVDCEKIISTKSADGREEAG